MRKIHLKFYKEGGVSCEEDHCRFNQECANHETAGMFREKDGFTPQLIKINEEWHCKTIDEPMANCRYQDLPINYEKLDRGALTIMDLDRENAPNYQI